MSREYIGSVVESKFGGEMRERERERERERVRPIAAAREQREERRDQQVWLESRVCSFLSIASVRSSVDRSSL